MTSIAERYMREWATEAVRKNEKRMESLVEDALLLKRRRINDDGNSIGKDAKSKHNGDAVLEALIKCFDEFEGYSRSSSQRQMHDEMLAALIPRIYGDEFDHSAERILKRLRRDEIHQEVLIVAQRRMGKSFGTAMFASAALISVPGVKIAVLGTTRESARRIVELVHTLINAHPLGRKMLRRPTNIDRVRLDDVQGNTRVMETYAGKSRSVRGFDADIIIVDEAAYIDEDLFFQGILPVCSQGKTALVCLSTPGGRDNFYSRLLTAKVTDRENETVFYGLRIGGACDACASDPVQRVLCSHVTAELPPWLNITKQRRFQSLYSGQEHIFKREFMGLITDDGSAFIRPEFVDALIEAPRTLAPQSSLIFIGIDPSGGGESSTAATALAGNNGIHIVALGSARVEDQMDWQEAFLRSMIGALRRKSAYASSTIVIACEGAPGTAAAVVASQLRGIQNVHFMTEVSGGRIGVPIDDRITVKMAHLLQTHLSSESIKIAADLVALGDGGRQIPADDIIKTLTAQIKRLAWVRARQRTETGKYKLTAKTSADSADLLMSFMHALYYRGVFLVSERTSYRHIREAMK